MIRLPWSEALHPAVGVYRQPDREGWAAFAGHEHERYRKSFPDSHYGGRAAALMVAIRWRKRTARELGITSRGWWLGPDNAGSVTLLERDDRKYWRACLSFQGDTLTKTFSVSRHGNAAARALAEQYLVKWRRDLRRICNAIVRERERRSRAA